MEKGQHARSVSNLVKRTEHSGRNIKRSQPTYEPLKHRKGTVPLTRQKDKSFAAALVLKDSSQTSLRPAIGCDRDDFYTGLFPDPASSWFTGLLVRFGDTSGSLRWKCYHSAIRSWPSREGTLLVVMGLGNLENIYWHGFSEALGQRRPLEALGGKDFVCGRTTSCLRSLALGLTTLPCFMVLHAPRP